MGMGFVFVKVTVAAEAAETCWGGGLRPPTVLKSCDHPPDYFE